MNLMFGTSLLSMNNFININIDKNNNVNLSTLIKCFNGYFIFNVDFNMVLV
jgi:hypothetical protein